MERQEAIGRVHRLVAELPVRAPALLVVVIVDVAIVATTALNAPRLGQSAAIVVGMLVAAVGAYALARFDGMVGTVGPALITIVLIAYVRDQTGGGDSGVAALFMIPIIWLALYATTAEALAGVAGAVAAILVPTLIGDPTMYDAGEEMRRVMSFVIVAGLVVALSWWVRRELLTDPLTRTGNRRSWEREITRELARAARSSESLVVAIIDLDHFKEYNDREGHMAGDRHLTESAAAWRKALRQEDILVRAGGEEFFLLLPRTSSAEAAAVLQRVRARTPNRQTCSIGHAVWDGKESAGSLLHRADQALYRAKAAGRDRVVAAPPTARVAA